MCARELPYGITLNARPIRRQHAVEKEISFAFLVQQFGRSLIHDSLEVVGVLLQLLQHVVDYVELPAKNTAPILSTQK